MKGVDTMKYDGKITNKGSQMVKAPIPMPGSKAPKRITGGDLRTKKSSK